jgi:hypothetical protein
VALKVWWCGIRCVYPRLLPRGGEERADLRPLELAGVVGVII